MCLSTFPRKKSHGFPSSLTKSPIMFVIKMKFVLKI